jgi:ATP-dependent helicase HrpB
MTKREHWFFRPSSVVMNMFSFLVPCTRMQTHSRLERPRMNHQVPDHVIPAVERALAGSEGHALVFLPGEGEVNAAIREFKKKNLKNCEALPLMGGMPPEEQDKVMMFDDRSGTKRMIVFCTNVAETSLTV